MALLGSYWSARGTEGVLACALGLTTLAWICRLCAVVVVTVPTVHTSVQMTSLACGGLLEMRRMPVGTRSVSCTLVAELGPLSERLTVKVIVSPRLGAA